MSPRRRRRTKWEDPISPLQAARFEKRWFQMDACRRLREICPGHGEGRPCRIEPSKLSDYERGKRWPSMKHVLALATLYGKTPAELSI
jgi:Helix-turn-helix